MFHSFHRHRGALKGIFKAKAYVHRINVQPVVSARDIAYTCVCKEKGDDGTFAIAPNDQNQAEENADQHTEWLSERDAAATQHSDDMDMDNAVE